MVNIENRTSKGLRRAAIVHMTMPRGADGFAADFLPMQHDPSSVRVPWSGSISTLKEGKTSVVAAIQMPGGTKAFDVQVHCRINSDISPTIRFVWRKIAFVAANHRIYDF